MAVGGASSVDKLETRVGLTGVEQVQRGASIIRASMRGIAGDVGHATSAWQKLDLSGVKSAAIGGSLVTGGYAALRAAKDWGESAAEAESASAQLLRALQNTHKGTARDVTEIEEAFDKLPKVVPGFHSAMIEAASAMATLGKATPDEIKETLPAILDTTVALQKMGRGGADVATVSAMVARGANGMTRGLKRLIPDLNEARVKSEGLSYIVAELEKRYHGAAEAESKTAVGANTAYENSVGALKRELGEGLVPAMVKMTTVMNRGVGAMRWLNKHTHGVAGETLAVAGAMGVVGGSILMVMPGIKALRDMWHGVAVAAGEAAVAEEAAAAAGAGATGAAAGGVATGVGKGVFARIMAGAGGLWGGARAIAGRGIGALGVSGVGSTAGITTAGLIGAAGWADVIDEALDWALGSIFGQGGKRLGNGGWLPNLSLGRAVGEGINGIGAGYSADRNRIRAFFAGRSANAYIRGGSHSIRRMMEAQAGMNSGGNVSPNSPSADPAITAINVSNNYLRKLVDLLGAQNQMIIGGGPRTSKALNEGDVRRAINGTLSQNTIG